MSVSLLLLIVPLWEGIQRSTNEMADKSAGSGSISRTIDLDIEIGADAVDYK